MIVAKMRLACVLIFGLILFENNESINATSCVKPEEVKETGSGIGNRIGSMSWTPMKQYLREQRTKLNLTKVEQDNCQSEFMEGFREALGGADTWSYSFYKPTVDEWFHKESDEAFKPWFQYGGYGY